MALSNDPKSGFQTDYVVSVERFVWRYRQNIGVFL